MIKNVKLKYFNIHILYLLQFCKNRHERLKHTNTRWRSLKEREECPEEQEQTSHLTI